MIIRNVMNVVIVNIVIRATCVNHVNIVGHLKILKILLPVAMHINAEIVIFVTNAVHLRTVKM